jgi:hypothetical protein
MITLTRLQTRPNTSVPFYYNMPFAARQAIVANYQGANATLLQTNMEFSSDNLVFAQIYVFTTQAACTAFQADPSVIADRDAKVAHCLANNIALAESTV